MNNFNKTEAAIFVMQAVLPEGFPFYQMITTELVYMYLPLFPAFTFTVVTVNLGSYLCSCVLMLHTLVDPNLPFRHVQLQCVVSNIYETT